MKRLMLLSLAVSVGPFCGCGSEPTYEERVAAGTAEINRELQHDAPAIAARLAQLGRVAELLQNPVVASSPEVSVSNFRPYPAAVIEKELLNPDLMGESGVTHVAIIRSNQFDRFSSGRAKNPESLGLTFLCRPWGFADDIDCLRDPACVARSFKGDANRYRRARALLLGPRFVVALEQLEYRAPALGAGAEPSSFTSGRVRYKAVLVDIDGPTVLAVWNADVSSSAELETRYRVKKRDVARRKQEAARQAANDALTRDLHDRVLADFERHIRRLSIASAVTDSAADGG